MNIEELELSLRSEFEGQMNNVIARLRQDVADFQKKFEAEFQRHREEMDRSIDELASRLPESFPLENAFTSTITEHLRLARDEGAQIAATAFGEAEKLKSGDAQPAGDARYDRVRDAINDISSKRTQAAILTALVEHATHFAPRGAFFIVKNDHFVGWKAFGAADESAVRDIRFTTKCHSTLSEAVHSLTTVRSEFGSYADDCNFLDPLGFGQPAEMYAVPLSARGRGVAVLYADKDSEGNVLNVEALETLVRVAGLTVELLAAHSAKPQHAEPAQKAEPEAETAAAREQAKETAETEAQPEPMRAAQAEVQDPQHAPEPNEVRTVEEQVPTAEYEFEATAAVYQPEPAAIPVAEEAAPPAYQFESTQTYEFESTSVSSYEPAEVAEGAAETCAEAPTVEPTVYEPLEDVKPSSEFEFTSNGAYDAPAPVEAAIPHVEFAAEEVSVVSNGNGYVHVPEPPALTVQPEPVVEAAPVPSAKPRLSERNVDLPIEVADEERKLHNDARRFARLLVSEIKLYNEQAVSAGRENHDLYDRLREAVDRSREMYEKRVKPAVASKFDYFHYELVNGLAEGDAKKLGGNYPGASV